MRALGDEPIQVLIVGALDAEVSPADVVDGLVINHETTVRVLQGGVSRENGVVRLNDGGSDLRSRVDAELQLALLAVVHRQALHEQGTKARSGTAPEGVEDQETLQSGAVVGHTSDLVQDLINQLLADRVVSASVVVRSILLPGDHLLRVEQTPICTGPDLIDDIGLKIAVDRSRDIFAVSCKGQIRSAF